MAAVLKAPASDRKRTSIPLGFPASMATVEDVYRKHKPQAFSPERRPSSFEVWSWFFMRISGVILLFLVLIHLYIIHLIGKGVEKLITRSLPAAGLRWDGRRLTGRCSSSLSFTGRTASGDHRGLRPLAGPSNDDQDPRCTR